MRKFQITTYHEKAYNVGRQAPRNRLIRGYQEGNLDFGNSRKPDVRHFEKHEDPFSGKVTTHKSRDAMIDGHPNHRALVEYWLAKTPHAKTEDAGLQADRLQQVDNPKTGKREWTMQN